MALAFRFAAVVTAVALAVGVSLPLHADEPKPADQPKPAEKPAESKPIDLVICLDVSGSMDGLIASAKIQLWNVVNELARIKPTPNLRVALYSYGASNYKADKGWVNKELDLTEDLDEVYRVLNGLKTGGGTELVARVTKAAIDEQKWSENKDALKVIFVCGNEPANQDQQVKLDDVAELAKKNNVVVNTIYCQWNHDNEIAGWSDFSKSCNGRHVNINQNKATTQITIKTEYDEQIIKLGEELNKTYVAYGTAGKEKAENQAKQDKNAKDAPTAPGAASTAAIARSESKAGALYRNSTWDLVDRMKEKDFDITKIKEEDLCDEMKKLKPEERLPFLKKKAEERAELQKKISDLSAKRQKKLDEERAKTPKTDAEKALDDAFKSVIRDQAKAKGFEVAPEKK